MRVTTFGPVSDAEGTRIATQSDRVGMSRAETFPDAKKIPADPAPETGRVPVPRTTPGRHRGPLSRKEKEALAEADTGVIPILDLFEDTDDHPSAGDRPASGPRRARDPVPLPESRPDRSANAGAGPRSTPSTGSSAAPSAGLPVDPSAGPPADVRTAQASVAERVHAFLPESLGPDTWDSPPPSAGPAMPGPPRPWSLAGLSLWRAGVRRAWTRRNRYS
ncbi:hypothetical protein GCM10010140_35050 [Streptosporangium pseudovulgare]|uniref:Uncharacterized protein n=1 Tax=Streptosporangium pseudovulgare TaxID=35765 RepID=A0ABQ2QZS9_9ACTN|nr:hypothetical protein GCM10010140_35050 [Streptosporangium pseudovulgare]